MNARRHVDWRRIAPAVEDTPEVSPSVERERLRLEVASLRQKNSEFRAEIIRLSDVIVEITNQRNTAQAVNAAQAANLEEARRVLSLIASSNLGDSQSNMGIVCGLARRALEGTPNEE